MKYEKLNGYTKGFVVQAIVNIQTTLRWNDLNSEEINQRISTKSETVQYETMGFHSQRETLTSGHMYT